MEPQLIILHLKHLIWTGANRAVRLAYRSDSDRDHVLQCSARMQGFSSTTDGSLSSAQRSVGHDKLQCPVQSVVGYSQSNPSCSKTEGNREKSKGANFTPVPL